MDYQYMLEEMRDDAHLIGMIPIREFIRFGFEAGFGPETKVLDLCCGYGTVLKAWSETFGLSGVGVDICEEFVTIGNARLQESNAKVKLVLGDVTAYQDETKYDAVILSETIGTIAETLALGEKFLKPGGLLAYQKLYAKVDRPPQALLDFDGEVLPLPALHRRFRELGYYMTGMVSDTDAKWQHYVMGWCGRRNLNALRKNPKDDGLRQWTEQWMNIYFECRRQYEGQALFGLERF